MHLSLKTSSLLTSIATPHCTCGPTLCSMSDFINSVCLEHYPPISSSLTSLPLPSPPGCNIALCGPSQVTLQDFAKLTYSCTYVVIIKCCGSHYTTPKLKVHVPFSGEEKFTVMSNAHVPFEVLKRSSKLY